ncbi:hypothetical protein NIES267_17970 [Calothrix parasitica NIES-267]|uniref:Uncharacterized protein n=1 Tax=Calothrix parasitica NIES-267 TaxID=1973488 RepID=A0A1Z4LMJ8_9CYAN|nr:hypothetical protein NIES267_17970 [Calothrix parasitica NIES-267]
MCLVKQADYFDEGLFMLNFYSYLLSLTQILHQCHKPGFLLLKQPHNNAFTSEKPGIAYNTLPQVS